MPFKGQIYLFSDAAKFIENDDLESLKKMPDLTIINKDLNSLLHIAAKNKNKKVAEFLLDNNLDVNMKNKKGQSSFNIACWKSDESLVDLFLKQNPDVNTQDVLGNTPLHNAIQNTNILGKLLENKANPYILNEDGNPVLHEAKVYKNSLEHLLEKKVNPNSINKNSQSLMHIAAEESNIDLAETLLKHKAEINFVDKYRRTPLFYTQNPEMLAFLLNNGANPNIEDKNKKTPLLLAQNNAVRIILLSYGADPDVLTSQGGTLLHMAVQKNNIDVAKTLLSFNASVNKLNKDEKAPLYYAQTNEMRRLLLENGANPNTELYLHYALRTDNEDFFEDLLESYADTNLKDELGRSPIYYCKNVEQIEKLLKKKANIDEKDNQENTPLLYYSAKGEQEIVNYLIENDADIFEINKFDKNYKDLLEDYKKYNSWIK